MRKYYHKVFSIIISIVIIASCSDGGGNTILSLQLQKAPTTLFLDSNNLGEVVINSTYQKSLIINASGSFDVSNIIITLDGNPNFSFTGGSYPGTNGTCNSTLDSGSSCSINIEFLTSVTGFDYETINYSYFNGIKNVISSEQIKIEANPELNINLGTTYSFGNKFIGSSTDLPITISNSSVQNATSFNLLGLSSPYAFKGGSFPGTGGTCSATIVAGQSCTLFLNFSPTVSGFYTNTITFSYFNNGIPSSTALDLTGWGLRPAVLSLSDPGTYDYGVIANNFFHRKVYTVTYLSGDVSALALGMSGVTSKYSIEGGWPGPGGTCGATLSSSQGSCTFVVSLKSTISGIWNSPMKFDYNNGQSILQISRNLTGITGPEPVLILSGATTFIFPTYNLKTPTVLTKSYTITYISGVFPATSLNVIGLGVAYRFAGGGSFPGSGGTCGTTLNTGSCTFIVEFLPSTRNSNHARSISLQYHDSITTRSIGRTLRGGTDGLPIKLDTTNFSDVVIGATQFFSTRLRLDGAVTITSVSGANLVGTEFSYNGGAYPGTGVSSCPNGTFSGADCNLYFSFTPTSTAIQNQNVLINYNDGFGAKSINFTLSSRGASAAALSITGVNFPDTVKNLSSTLTYNISNSGGVSATSMSGLGIAAPFYFQGGSYPGTGGSCSTNLPAGSSCSIKIIFSPTSPGSFSDTLLLNYHNGLVSTSTSKFFTGNGTLSSQLYLSHNNTYNFGGHYLNNGTDVTFTMSHGGGASTANIGTISLGSTQFIFPGGTFPGGGTCGATLSLGATCTFIVRFKPTSSGLKSGNILVNYNNGSLLNVNRLIQGTGLTPSTLSISGSTPINYGSIIMNQFSDLTITINKTGENATLVNETTLTAPFAFKGGNYPGTGGNCAATISTSACTIVIRYSPINSGTHNSTITLNYNNGISVVNTTKNITGIGLTSAALNFSLSSYDFGSVTHQTIVEKILTLNYSGEGTANTMAANTLTAPFSYKGGTYPGTGGTCNTTLASGSCTIILLFSPLSTTSFSDTITLSYNDGNGLKNTSVNLSGSGKVQALLNFSIGSSYDFGDITTGSNADFSLTLLNGGASDATSLSGTGFIAPFSFKGGSYPGTGGTCNNTLASGASCIVVVTYSPITTGNFSDLFEINYNDGISTSVLITTLNGTSSALILPAMFEENIPLQKIDLSLFHSKKRFIDELLIINDTDIFSLNLENDSLSYQGFSRINLGDINDDRVDDFLIGFPFLNKFIAYNGDTMKKIYSIEIKEQKLLSFGVSSILGLDHDLDGVKDIKTAKYFIDHNKILRIKEIKYYSAKTGQQLEDFFSGDKVR